VYENYSDKRYTDYQQTSMTIILVFLRMVAIEILNNIESG